MMIPRIGFLVDDGGPTAAVITARGHVEIRTLDRDENLAGSLRSLVEMDARWVRRIRTGLDRRLVTVKIVDLPPAAGADLTKMVSFELERHLPFSADEAATAFTALSPGGDGRVRVLVAACERRTVEWPLRVLAEAGRKPMAVSVACHDLAALVPRAALAKRVVWIHRRQGHADIVLLAGGHVCLSRGVMVEDPEALAAEVRRSLPLVGWSDCEAVWVSGEQSEALLASPPVRELAPTSEPPYGPEAARLVAALGEDNRGTRLLALAVAMGSRRPSLDLLAPEHRPWTVSREQVITAGMAAVTALFGVALLWAQPFEEQRYLTRLSAEIRRLDPEVKAVEQMVAETAGKAQLVGTLRSMRAESVPVLPTLLDLTQILPADAWLQSVSMDRQGVELIGQANAASQLIPLLENSPWLERVEFTSPVTRGQDKEQFRIKAAWERPVVGRPVAARDGR
jgi:Tfp pilus assembly protein PilN